MRLSVTARYVAAFIADGLAWETVRVGSMNSTDRRELVDRLLDASVRMRRQVVNPPLHTLISPAPRDSLEARSAAEFVRCGGDPRKLVAGGPELPGPIVITQVTVSRQKDERERGRHLYLAAGTSTFRLRAAAICREMGVCRSPLPADLTGPVAETAAWERNADAASVWPATLANAKPFTLSLACGMGMREKQGLPACPAQASLEAADKAWEAGRAHHCATGKQIACP